MYDKVLVKEILCQIKDALEKIAQRTTRISCTNDFTESTPNRLSGPAHIMSGHFCEQSNR